MKYDSYVSNVGCIGCYSSKKKAVEAAKDTIRNSNRADDYFTVFDNSGEIVAEGRIQRIGSKMQQVVDYVEDHPGCPKSHPARAITPHRRGLQHGYRTVNRTIRAGLIKAELQRGRYRLTPISPS